MKTTDLETANAKRLTVASAAVAVQNLSMGKDPSEYEEFEAPLEINGQVINHASGYWWSCATTVMGIMRSIGVQDALLWTQYIIGRAMSNDVQIAQKEGAWRTWGMKNPDGSDCLPNQGDFVLVGPGGFHILTIVEIVQGFARAFATVEGGQADAKGMAIKRLSRQLFVQDGALYCGNSIGPSTKVYGWIDCTALDFQAL